MEDIILYISIIVIGGIIGTRLRGYEEKLAWRDRVQTLAIMALVILMGSKNGMQRASHQ